METTIVYWGYIKYNKVFRALGFLGRRTLGFRVAFTGTERQKVSLAKSEEQLSLTHTQITMEINPPQHPSARGVRRSCVSSRGTFPIPMGTPTSCSRSMGTSISQPVICVPGLRKP